MRRRYTLADHRRLFERENRLREQAPPRSAELGYHNILATWHSIVAGQMEDHEPVDLRHFHDWLATHTEERRRDCGDYPKGARKARAELLAGKHGHPSQEQLLAGTVHEERDEHSYSDEVELSHRSNPRGPRDAVGHVRAFHRHNAAKGWAIADAAENGYHDTLASWHWRAGEALDTAGVLDLPRIDAEVAHYVERFAKGTWGPRDGSLRAWRTARLQGGRRALAELWAGKHGHPSQAELLASTVHEGRDEHSVADEVQRRENPRHVGPALIHGEHLTDDEHEARRAAYDEIVDDPNRSEATRGYYDILAMWHASGAWLRGRPAALVTMHDRMRARIVGAARPSKRGAQRARGMQKAHAELLAGYHGHPSTASLLELTVHEGKDEHWHADTAEQQRNNPPRRRVRHAPLRAGRRHRALEEALGEGCPLPFARPVSPAFEKRVWKKRRGRR